MANRIAATYNGASQTNHTVSFTAPTAGARLILLVSSYNGVTAAPAGWTQELVVTGYNFLYIFTKIAAGTETSVAFTLSGAGIAHAVLHERDDCPTRLFVGSGETTATSTSVSATATVPNITTGRVFGVLNTPTASAASTTWNQGLARHFAPTGTSSNSAFAHGPLPAAGSRTFTVSGLTASSNRSLLAVIAYGVTDTAAPTVPGNLRTTAVTGTQIDVAWDASTDEVGVTGYGIYRDGVKQGADQAGLTYSFTGLTVGQSYTIEVDARDGAGNRSARAQIVVTTDAVQPTVPGNLRTTAIGHTSISVAWDASTDDLTGVAGYGLYLDGAKQGVDLAGLAATLPGLVPGQTYTIEVDARDGAGNRSARAQITVQTTPDTLAPTVPGNLRTTQVTPYSVAFAWDAASDDVAVAGYGTYLGGVKQGVDLVMLAQTLPGLTPDTAYVVEVDAVDTSGNRSARATLNVATPPDGPPGTPAGLHATDVTYTSISVAWSAATDDVSVVGYDVGFDDEMVATNQPAMTATFTDLRENTQHTARIWAVDSAGQRSVAPAELTLSTLDDTPPTPPAFTAAAGEDRITVAWEPSGDDFAVTHYDVRVNGVTVWSTPGVDYTVDGPVTRRRTVTGLDAGALHAVRVVAVDSIGQESADNTQLVQTTPTPFLPLATPLYRLGGWAGNVRDAHGVEWVVQREEGWSSSPPVSPVAAPLGGVDGVHPAAGRYGKRTITLEGVAIAPSRAAMLAAKQRLAGVLHPRQVGVLRVQDARYTRQARVRLVGRVEITDEGERAFTWSLTVSAADPRRYAVAPVSATAVISALPGQASATLTLAGTYPEIPARIRLYGPLQNWTLTHEESGTVMRAMPGTVLPANSSYSLGLDLATRQVWAYVPPEVWPEPRPGRSMLAHLPAWFHLLPGLNTLTLAGEPVAGQVGTPRMAVEAFDAWV
ncbi:fibronectin type III domain-containing protein (plasmid) [Streptosporangium sandarakinum]|uniref:fibronectin type III domain-containing protein n=1 Tax=Streptosporangium sandarakinum TaxID=1260955 RepID=UPI003D8BF45C